MAFYVTIRDSSGRRTIFAAGPFNRHGDALNAVGWVRRHVIEAFPSDRDEPWAAYGTSRVKSAPLPAGRFNAPIGLPEGRIAESPLAPNRWWTPGKAPDLPRRAPQRRPARTAAPRHAA